ncbi:MAG: hypothetical protein HY804_06975 [Nitrospinae bacterium]|nr:hypothetical protein [Nitrospinota bacterium]
MIDDDTKRTIDEMPESELRTEIELENRSRFNKEKRGYMRSRLNDIEAEKAERQQDQDTLFKSQEIAEAKEANKISKGKYRLLILSLIISIVALLIAILY